MKTSFHKRKVLKLVSFIFFVILFSNCKTTTTTTDISPENESIANKANLYLTKLTELNQFNGTLFLRKNNEVLLHKAYNVSKSIDSSLYVTKGSQFDLRSIAKLFAKVSLVQLEKEKKINTNTSLSNYLPDFPNAEKITIHQLMENTSGLPRSFETPDKPFIELSREEVVNLAAKSKLEFEPGANQRYSNVGFQLLYYTIGKITDSTYEAYILNKICKPLNMLRTGSNFYSGKDRKQLYADGHYLNKQGSLVAEGTTYPKDEMRMGNLFSTASDMDIFINHLDTVNYKSLVYDNSISHAGGTRGKRAYVERNFVDDYSIVFLANYDQIPFQTLVNDLQTILKGETVVMPAKVDRKAVPISAKILQKYTGSYDIVDAGHIVLDIKLENDSLYVYQKGKNNGVLYAESKNIFFADKNAKESIQFILNKEGKYDLLIDFQGVQWTAKKIDK